MALKDETFKRCQTIRRSESRLSEEDGVLVAAPDRRKLTVNDLLTLCKRVMFTQPLFP